MTTYTKSGSFGWAGGGKGGAVVDLWAASRFTGPPAENDAPPAGNPDAGPVTTGVNFGNPGAYLIDGIAVAQDYYVRVQYGGNTYWGACPISTLGGISITGPPGPAGGWPTNDGAGPGNLNAETDLSDTFGYSFQDQGSGGFALIERGTGAILIANANATSAQPVILKNESANGQVWLLATGTGGNILLEADDGPITLQASDGVTCLQIATPTNPPSGSNKLYFKSDGNLYKLDSSGTETLIG